MRSLTRFLSGALLMAAWHSFIPGANAQAPQPGLSTTAPEISDQKLDAAAAALARITTLEQTYRQRLAQAATPSDQQRILAEANNALTKAVAEGVARR
jgi:malic enzyme